MKWLLRFSKKYSLHILGAAVASVGSALAHVWAIDLLKDLINNSLQGDMGNIYITLLKGIMVVLFGMLASYLVILTTGRFGAGVLHNIRESTMNHVVKLSPEFMEKNDKGDLIARLTSDVEGISFYLAEYFKDCLYIPIMVIVFAGYLISIHPLLAMCTLAPLGILIPISIVLMDPIKKSQMEYTKKVGKTNNNISEVCDGISVVKSYNLQAVLGQKYYRDLHKTLVISQKNDLKQYHVVPITYLINDLPIAITLGLGGYFVFKGQITLGVLVAFISVMNKLIEPLGNAYQLVVKTKLAFVWAERVFFILDTKVEEEQIEIHKREGEVRNQQDTNHQVTKHIFKLKDVTFAYSGMEQKKGTPKKNALEHIDLEIKKGQKVAFVGRSGGGKSTLLKLLYRHYEITSGEIYYKGNHFQSLNPNDIREDVALISQDVYLFPMSVADNIRIGKVDATDEEVKAAAQMANCDEFIQGMPNGYDTIIEENGMNLSGGQRQRISIARAILKQADIILLDEPTSALDHESEHIVNEAIDRISKGKTVVVVAHRLSTITNSDQIIVVDSGKIIERGKHDELMALEGVYAELYREYMAEEVA